MRGFGMAAKTSLLQIAVAIVNFAIFLLAFTSIWPFPNGDFKIDLPSPNDVSWDFDNGEVRITAPYSVDNGGFYDVDGLVIRYSVANSSGAPIASDDIRVGTLPAGAVTSGVLIFYLDLVELYQQGIEWMVFYDDWLNFDIEVSCYYTMKLIKFDAAYSVTVPWDALIRELSIQEITPDSDGNGFTVWYRLETSPILNGLSAGLTLTYLDNGTSFGSASQNIVIGQVDYWIHFDTLGFVVPDDGDSIRIELELDGLTVEKEVRP